MAVLQRRRDRADHHDPVTEAAGLEGALDRARERDVADVPGRARVVDPRALAAQPLAVDRLARHALDGRHRQRPQPVDLVRQPPQRARRALRQQPVADRGARELLARGAAEDLRRAVLADLGGAEDDVAGLARVEDQHVVALHVLRLLGELDVVDDRPRLVAGHAGQRLGERAAREHPALLQLVERHVVDPQHHDVVRDRARPADLEARVDGRELGAIERPGGVEHDHRAEREQGHRREQGPAQAAGGRAAAHALEANRRGALPGTDFLHSARSWPPDASR